jgi:Asp-tRNA(Asn)/Glu-tRNA(Gln) amidotransferase A subunit family amidase
LRTRVSSPQPIEESTIARLHAAYLSGDVTAATITRAYIGTDTGGSVRAPASINNLVGVRPTVGLVSRTGMAPLDSRRDTPGPMCRSVEDAARLCGAYRRNRRCHAET